MQEMMVQQKHIFQTISDLVTTVDLRILETTDLHVHLHPYDYYADSPNPDLGLVRLAELVDQARREAPNCLLFDNGDFLQGTPVGDYFAYDMGLKEGNLHPVTAAMNALRYDAITLGNHEFNYGLPFLMKSLARADFPIVSANILRGRFHDPRKDIHLVKPYSLIDRMVTDHTGQAHPIRIGVIGVAPPQITLWERQHLHGQIETRDMVQATSAWVPEMREAGADLVILLAHTGIGAIRHTEDMENAVIPLAGIKGVDIVLSGHSHQVFPSRMFANIPSVNIRRGTICGKPTVMSGFFGSHLGVIDLRLCRDGGKWSLLDHHVDTWALRDISARFTPIAPAPSDQPMRSPKVRKIVARAHKAVLENMRQPIGTTCKPINSFFVALGRSAATRFIAMAQSQYVSKRLSDATLAELPVLSSVSPSKAGGLGGARNFTDIAAGSLTLRSLADLYVYPNRIAALKITGAELKLWLERSASVFAQFQGGADQDLMDTDFPAYNFEIVYGVTYEIDLTAPARFAPDGSEISADHARICNLCFQGQPVAPDDQFILCTNSFRAQGAGGFAGAVPDNIVFEAPAITRDILRDYVRDTAALDIEAVGPFSFVPISNQRAILRTAVAAHAHLDLIDGYTPQILGADKRGFLRVAVTL